MKILVTGAAGFIGMHLCLRLIKDGHSVVAIDNLNDYYDVNLKYARLQQLGMNSSVYEADFACGNFSFHKIDIVDNERLMEVFKSNSFDVVCHLAAQAGVRYSITNPDSYIESNLVGFFNILECCRWCTIPHLVYASSSSVYGGNKKLPYSIDDATETPVSLYAATKKSNELLANSYSSLYGFKATGLRFFTVYGPWGRPDMAPYIFTESVLKDREIRVHNNGNMSRDFTYIDDIIDGVVASIERPSQTINHRLFNLGNGSPVNLIDFICHIEKSCGKIAKMRMLPMQKGDVISTCADISLSSRELNYYPKIGIEEGLSRFVEWFVGR